MSVAVTQTETKVDTTSVSRPSGVGPLPQQTGVAFRVWAPNAESVSVIGSFNDWNDATNPMEQEGNGHWFAQVDNASVGDEYKYRIKNGEQTFDRIDPRVRQVTNSVGSGVIHELDYDWSGDDFKIANWNELVIYEMHVGSFNRDGEDVGTFSNLQKRFDHLKRLGVNALQLMPIAEFAGDLSWGYNPAHIFAIESAYGGPKGFKDLVKAAHQAGFAIILDVVYNHFGPSDLDLWQFDGWSENEKGGIYFYNDHRSQTPWGDSRPDYGRGEVRSFIRDNAMMWFEDYHIDGLRYDMTLFIRTIDGNPGSDIPEGWGLTQWINREIHANYPAAITIAEDLQDNAYLTKSDIEGGAGFSAQWDAGFVHPIRAVITTPADQDRSMNVVRDALLHCYNCDAFQRVVYTESHDEVANGKSRVPNEIAPADEENKFAQKRSTLGAALVMTAPGIPMLFQGQEFLQGGYFKDAEELDWQNEKDFSGIVRLYADLIQLRLNRGGASRGLTGQGIEVFHLNDADKLIAYRRFAEGGASDDVVVFANFSSKSRTDYKIGFPCSGQWRLRLNTDASTYSPDFGNFPSENVEASCDSYDSQPASGVVSIAPYTVLVFSQNAE